METIKKFFRENIYFNLFWCFFKVGVVTIGGGVAMVPILQEKICEEYRWMSQEEILDCITVSQGLPGVIAINMATYVGYFKRGLRGALCSTLGVILPSFVIIILVVLFLEEVGGNPYVGGLLEGIKAAATGLIAYAAWKLGKQTLKNAFQWTVAIIAFILLAFVGVDAVWVVLAGLLVGEIYYAIKGAKEGKKNADSN